MKESTTRVSFKPTTYSPRSRNSTIARALKKHSNSCSTIYVDDSTVAQPNWKAMIKCVSHAIHSQIVHRTSNRTMEIFDEKLHPLTVRRIDFLLIRFDIFIFVERFGAWWLRSSWSRSTNNLSFYENSFHCCTINSRMCDRYTSQLRREISTYLIIIYLF